MTPRRSALLSRSWSSAQRSRPGSGRSETPALLAYIAQTFPAAKLAPLDDPFAFARLQAFNSYLCSTVHVAHAHRPRGARWSDDPAVIEALKIKVPQNMRDCFELIERDMFYGPWVMGAKYTVADPYFFAVTKWLKSDGVDVRTLPKTNEHHARMVERAAVRRVLALYP